MFVVTEADEAAIRAAYQQQGEFAAAVELRRRFPGITDNAQARECARTIAGWKPLPLRPVKRAPRLRRMVRRLTRQRRQGMGAAWQRLGAWLARLGRWLNIRLRSLARQLQRLGLAADAVLAATEPAPDLYRLRTVGPHLPQGSAFGL